VLWQVRKPKFRFSDQRAKGNQFSPLWRTGFQEGTETGIPLGRLDFMSKQKTSAHHRLHPCNLNLHLQGWAECPDVKNNPGHPGNLQDVQDDPSPMWQKGQNSQRLLFSFVRGLLPWAFRRRQGTWEADTWEYTSSWSQASYQRRSQRQHFSVNSANWVEPAKQFEGRTVRCRDCSLECWEETFRRPERTNCGGDATLCDDEGPKAESGDEAQDEPGDGRAAEQEPAATARPPEESQRRENILRNRAPRRRYWRILQPTRTALLQYVRRLHRGAGPPRHRPSRPWQLAILPRRGRQHAPGLRVRRQRLGR